MERLTTFNDTPLVEVDDDTLANCVPLLRRAHISALAETRRRMSHWEFWARWAVAYIGVMGIGTGVTAAIVGIGPSWASVALCSVTVLLFDGAKRIMREP